MPRRVASLPSTLCPVLYTVGFVLLSAVFLLGRNADLLFFLQDRGWWNSTPVFWGECMRLPGGLLAWTGAYLTQFFFHPWLGTSLLIALWIATFAVARRSFKVREQWSLALYAPMLALLCSIIQLGYWAYFMKDIDYVFYHSLGLFAAIALSFDYARFLPDKGRLRPAVSLALMLAVGTGLYWPLGFYALLAVAIMAAKALRRDLWGGLPSAVAAAAIIGFVPHLEAMGCTALRPDQVWTIGFRHFEIASVHDTSMERPFLLAALLPLLFPLLQPRKEGFSLTPWARRLEAVAVVAVATLMVWCTCQCDFTDYNFHAELRMQRAVEEQRWADVLREARACPGSPTREMMMFRDIALFNTDDIGSVRYTYNNDGIPPAPASDSIYVRIRDQAADLIYYNLGETTFAIRRAIERCMHYGYGHYTLRQLTRCALVNGESLVARKYLNLLAHTTFHRQWAQEMMPLAEDEKRVEQDERFRIPLHLYRKGIDQIGTDRDLIEASIIDKWAHTASDDPFAQSIALYYSMLSKDPQPFFAQLFQSMRLNPGKPIPLHYQEAAWFYATEVRYPVRQKHGIDISHVPIDEVRVKQRMARFLQFVETYARQGLNEKQIGQMLRAEFGDTFWWSYCVHIEEYVN